MEKDKKYILKGILFAVLVVILIFAIMMIKNFIILRKLTDLSKYNYRRFRKTKKGYSI